MEQLSVYVQDSSQESSGDEEKAMSKSPERQSDAKADKVEAEKTESLDQKEKVKDGSSSEGSRKNSGSESSNSDSEPEKSKRERSHDRDRRKHRHSRKHHRDDSHRRRHHRRHRSDSRERRHHRRRHSRHSPHRHSSPHRHRSDRHGDRHSDRHGPRGDRHGDRYRRPYRRSRSPRRSPARSSNVSSMRDQQLAARAAQAAAANQEVIAQTKLSNAISSGKFEIGALQAKDLSMTDIARLVKQNVKTHNATPQEALEKTFSAMQDKVQELTGIKMPGYYNPAAVNPLKFAEQQQKRKLLWSKAKENKEESETMWSSVFQSTAGDEKSADKMKKLMGIRHDAQGELPSKAEEQLKKQQEVFSNLDKEYEFARHTTHMSRGMGLGFTTQFNPAMQQQPGHEQPSSSHSK